MPLASRLNNAIKDNGLLETFISGVFKLETKIDRRKIAEIVTKRGIKFLLLKLNTFYFARKMIIRYSSQS